MSYFKRHMFICTNQRDKGEACCAAHDAQAMVDHAKKRVKAAGVGGEGGVRVQKAGCLGRCDDGPVAVVYPEGTWYTFVDKADIDEIVDSHLVGGTPVDRLKV